MALNNTQNGVSQHTQLTQQFANSILNLSALPKDTWNLHNAAQVYEMLQEFRTKLTSEELQYVVTIQASVGDLTRVVTMNLGAQDLESILIKEGNTIRIAESRLRGIINSTDYESYTHQHASDKAGIVSADTFNSIRAAAEHSSQRSAILSRVYKELSSEDEKVITTTYIPFFNSKSNKWFSQKRYQINKFQKNQDFLTVAEKSGMKTSSQLSTRGHIFEALTAIYQAYEVSGLINMIDDDTLVSYIKEVFADVIRADSVGGFRQGDFSFNNIQYQSKAFQAQLMKIETINTQLREVQALLQSIKNGASREEIKTSLENLYNLSGVEGRIDEILNELIALWQERELNAIVAGL